MGEINVFENPEFGKVRAGVFADGRPCVAAKDVVESLGLVWNGSASIKNVPEEWRGVTLDVTHKKKPKMLCLTLEGLNFFLFRSDSPKALPMQKWLAGEVLPSIQKTGQYTAGNQNIGHSTGIKYRELYKMFAIWQKRTINIQESLTEIQKGVNEISLHGIYGEKSDLQDFNAEVHFTNMAITETQEYLTALHKDIINNLTAIVDIDNKNLSGINTAERQKQREEKKKTLTVIHDKAAVEGRLIAAVFRDATDKHAYLVHKGVKAYPGLKIDVNGDIFMLLLNTNFDIRSCHSMYSSDKSFESNSETMGNFFMIGNINFDGTGRVIICEEYATGASIYESTGITTIVAVTANNLPHVAYNICEKYPFIKIIIAADNDHKLEMTKAGNVGILKANEAAELCGGDVVIPEFTAKEKKAGYANFNDMCRAKGKEAVFNSFVNIINTNP